MSASSLRILFVAPYYKPDWGGIERAIDRLGAELRAAGHATGIVATHFSFPRRHRAGLAARETIDGGLAVYRVPARPPSRRKPMNFCSKGSDGRGAAGAKGMLA